MKLLDARYDVRGTVILIRPYTPNAGKWLSAVAGIQWLGGCALVSRLVGLQLIGRMRRAKFRIERAEP